MFIIGLLILLFKDNVQLFIQSDMGGQSAVIPSKV